MLPEIFRWFGDMTVEGVVAGLIVGLLTGFGLRDVLDWAMKEIRDWYAHKHE